MGPTVFNTDEGGPVALAGSIPVRLRYQPVCNAGPFIRRSEGARYDPATMTAPHRPEDRSADSEPVATPTSVDLDLPLPALEPLENPGAGQATKRTARNAAVSAAADVAGKVATLAYTVIAVRELSTADYGAFAFAISLALLAGALPTWGFDTVVVQQGSKDRAALPRLLAESLAWKGAISLPLFGLIALFSAGTRDGHARTALLMVLVATLLDLVDASSRNATAALQRLAGVSAALVVQRLLTAGLAIAALLTGRGLVGLAAAYLFGSAFGTATVVVARRRLGVRADFKSVTRTGLRALLRASTSAGLLGLVAMALFRIDAVLLAFIRGDAEVAAYTAAYRLVETVLFIAWAAGRALFPVMAAAGDAREVRQAVDQGVAAVGAVYVPFGVVALFEGPAVLAFVYSPQYEVLSGPTLQWLALAPLFFAIAYLAQFALLARHRDSTAVWAATAAAAANVAINLALIPVLGGPGAAIATTAAYVVETVAMLLLCRPAIGLPRPDRALVQAALAGAALAATLFGLRLHVVAEVVVGSVVYAAVWLALVRRSRAPHLALIRSLVPGLGR